MEKVNLFALQVLIDDEYLFLFVFLAFTVPFSAAFFASLWPVGSCRVDTCHICCNYITMYAKYIPFKV